jgi:hypothetical protein
VEDASPPSCLLPEFFPHVHPPTPSISDSDDEEPVSKGWCKGEALGEEEGEEEGEAGEASKDEVEEASEENEVEEVTTPTTSTADSAAGDSSVAALSSPGFGSEGDTEEEAPDALEAVDEALADAEKPEEVTTESSETEGTPKDAVPGTHCAQVAPLSAAAADIKEEARSSAQSATETPPEACAAAAPVSALESSAETAAVKMAAPEVSAAAPEAAAEAAPAAVGTSCSPTSLEPAGDAKDLLKTGSAPSPKAAQHPRARREEEAAAAPERSFLLRPTSQLLVIAAALLLVTSSVPTTELPLPSGAGSFLRELAVGVNIGCAIIISSVLIYVCCHGRTAA